MWIPLTSAYSCLIIAGLTSALADDSDGAVRLSRLSDPRLDEIAMPTIAEITQPAANDFLIISGASFPAAKLIWFSFWAAGIPGPDPRISYCTADTGESCCRVRP